MNIQNTIPLRREEKAPSMNPMIRRITEAKGAGREVSTYSGIFGKFAYFMVMLIVGIAMAMIFKGAGGIGIEPVTREVYASAHAVLVALASAFMFLLFPLLAFIVRKTIPVAGALYSVSTGYLLGFILALETELSGYILLATVLTFSLVFAMAFLYFTGRVRVTNRFRTITTVMFTTMILSSLAMLISYFIPGLREGVLMLQSNPVISIAASVGGIIVAALFLLIDFETVTQTVEDRLPKEYEWYAAFGVFFTVVWVYLKVLDLIIKVKDARI